MEEKLYVREIRPGVYLMDEAHQATGYLVVGKERACVIDTMNGLTDLRKAVRDLTDQDALLDLATHLPAEAGEALLDLALGHPPKKSPTKTSQRHLHRNVAVREAERPSGRDRPRSGRDV